MKHRVLSIAASQYITLVLLRSSRSTTRSRSSTAIEGDRNRDLSYSIFADFRWVMASMCNHQCHYAWCTRLRPDSSATQWNDVGRRSIYTNLPPPTASRMPNSRHRMVPLKPCRPHRPW